MKEVQYSATNQLYSNSIVVKGIGLINVFLKHFLPDWVVCVSVVSCDVTCVLASISLCVVTAVWFLALPEAPEACCIVK